METYQKGNLVINVSHDDFADNPRDWDNLSKMVCSHRKYNIGDKHDINFQNFNSWSEVMENLVLEHDAKVILPVYMYEHSDIALSHTPFSCRFDSGQIGFIYATSEQIKKEYGSLSKEVLNKVEEILIAELNIYSYYVSGEVYYIQLFEKDCEDCFDMTTIYGYGEMRDEIDRLLAEEKLTELAA